MNPNVHSVSQRTGPPIGPPPGLSPEPPPGRPAEQLAGAPQRSDGLAGLAAAADRLAAQDLDGLSDAALAERVLQLQRLLDRLEGQWLAELAAIDGRGAAGADQGVQAASTASWLRHRLHMGAGTAATAVRTARALFRGPLTQTAHALTTGEVSPAHAAVLAAGTQELPPHTAMDAEPVLLEGAGRLDPPRLRRVVGHLQQVADPEGADHRSQRLYQRRGLWLAATWEGMVAINGTLDPEAGQLLAAALDPWPAHKMPTTAAAVASATPTPWPSWLGGPWRGGGCPGLGGCGPSWRCWSTWTAWSPPGWGGWGARLGRPPGPGGVPRLACDAAVTRVVVSRQPSRGPLDGHGAPGHHDHPGEHDPGDHQVGGHEPGGHDLVGQDPPAATTTPTPPAARAATPS
jgi:Domain of unknown function (DUF222)